MAMKSSLIAGLGLLVLFSTAEASTPSGRLNRDGRVRYVEPVGSGERITRDPRLSVVRGKKGRKYARRFSLRANLSGDKLRIFDEYGYTPHRLGMYAAGERTERWKYYSLGVEFVFDHDSNLIDTRHFPPVGNHID